jgi:hypothetical protein
MGTTYLAEVSRFDSVFALWIILIADLAITLIHILQEWKGEEVPLWRVFGAIAGVCVPHRLGFLLFTLGLGVLLSLAGVVGITGLLCVTCGVVALAFIIGGRISDCVVSHWRPYAIGYRPNPGLSSTVLYILEAAFLLWAFWKGLSGHPWAALLGLVAGAVLFVLVQPGLRWLRESRWVRTHRPAWRREPWVRGQPLPAWTKVADCNAAP